MSRKNFSGCHERFFLQFVIPTFPTLSFRLSPRCHSDRREEPAVWQRHVCRRARTAVRTRPRGFQSGAHRLNPDSSNTPGFRLLCATDTMGPTPGCPISRVLCEKWGFESGPRKSTSLLECKSSRNVRCDSTWKGTTSVVPHAGREKRPGFGPQPSAAGGWPRLLDSQIEPTKWVPRPCVFCKGGYRTADIVRVFVDTFR